MYEYRGTSDEPEFDQALADSYVGRYILVGVTYLDHFGKELERVQFHGVIESVSREGVRIALRGKRDGEYWTMPPDLNSIFPAKPGTYSLHGTGEVIEDPDFLAKWTVNKPCQH